MRKTCYLPSGLVVLGNVALSPAFAQTIVQNWTGVTRQMINGLGEDLAPPDTMGAVGPNHVVQLTNGACIVYDKVGNVVSSAITDAHFWQNAGINSTVTNAGISDPHIMYDPSSGRWFASEINVSSTGNQMMVARSNSSDPTAGWKAVNFRANVGFGDYPALSVDGNSVYISVNNFTSDVGNFSGTSLFNIPKTDLLQSTPVVTNMTAFENLAPAARGFTLQAAETFGTSPTHGVIVSTALDSSGNYVSGIINRFNVNNPTGAGATLTSNTAIGVLATLEPPLGHQPDGTAQIDTLDSRISSNVIYQNGKLFMVRTVNVSNKSAIRWTVLDEATNAVVSEGTIANSNFDYYQGSIAINATGDVVLGFNRSGTGTSDFIGSYARVGKFDGTNITFGTDIVLQSGLANYHLIGGAGERWGDFSATRLDPTDSSLFWTFQEFAGTNNNWQTQVTAIRINSSVPEPSVLMPIIGTGSLGIFLFSKRKRIRRK